jgi:hypothetical protein
MLNQVVLVGRIEEIPKKENNRNENIFYIWQGKCAIDNKEDNQKDDIFKIEISDSMYENVKDLSIDDLIGIKGKLKSDNQGMFLLAEKITFLSGKGLNEQAKRDEM